MKLTFRPPFYDTYEGKLKFSTVCKKRLSLRKKVLIMHETV